MEKNTTTPPETMIDAVRYFSDEDVCLSFLASLRWPDGTVTCPECGSPSVLYLKNQRRWKCREDHPRRQFSIKVGTIFEDSPIGLDKWLPAVWMIVNAKNGVSSYEVARALGVTQKTAWFMLHRIRVAMQRGGFDKFSGHVEADETFIGAKARNMHKSKRARLVKGSGPFGSSKTAVFGLLQRHPETGESTVVTKVIDNIRTKTLDHEVRSRVEPGSNIYTDALSSYRKLGDAFVHQVIDHAEAYVRGHVHTNGLENFWALLKRAIKGTYVNVEPFHLFRYLDEQSFRFNARKGTDALRFVSVLRSIVGRRLTYKQLTGQSPEMAPA